MFKFFKKNRNNAEFNFGEAEEKAIGKFVEYNYKKGLHREVEFFEKDRPFLGGWICEAKVNGNEYNVVMY